MLFFFNLAFKCSQRCYYEFEPDHDHDRILILPYCCSFPIFMSRFRRKVITVVSFILSAVGAIGALLLSDNDNDKGKMNLTN